MSTAKRVFSGTVASWVRIGVTMASQIVLVPLFLTYWNLETYGAWLAVQAIVSLLSTLDRAFCDYSEYEYLKAGADNKAVIARLLWSGLQAMAVIGAIEIVLIGTLAWHSDSLAWLLKNKATSTGTAFAWAFMIQWLTWGITNAVGMFARVMSVFGYFARMTWWGVLISSVQALAPIVALVMGGGIVQASLWTAALVIPALLGQVLDVLRIFRTLNVPFVKPSLTVGFQHFKTSTLLALRYFLDNFKQQGIRLLIAPALGVAPLATFTTTRTGANVILQGLSTITNPMLPEMMRFLHQRNQQKLEMTFDTIWFIVIALMAPGVVIIQWLGPYFFDLWTKGKIVFDPLLFALLSMGVLVYAAAQVSLAILNGNNLLRNQLILSVMGSITLLSGLLVLLPILKLAGAGVALLVGEVVAALIGGRMAAVWLKRNELSWPRHKSHLVVQAIVVTTIGLLAMSWWPAYLVQAMLGTLLLLLINAIVYWRAMDESATAIIQQTVNRYVYRVLAR